MGAGSESSSRDLQGQRGPAPEKGRAPPPPPVVRCAGAAEPLFSALETRRRYGGEKRTKACDW